MTMQAHTVLQLFLGIKITLTQGNYFALIIICHEHQNKLNYILWELYIDKVIIISSLIKPFIGNCVRNIWNQTLDFTVKFIPNHKVCWT